MLYFLVFKYACCHSSRICEKDLVRNNGKSKNRKDIFQKCSIVFFSEFRNYRAWNKLFWCFNFFSDVESVCTDCTSSPDWIYPLCITFGILFLVMLIINVFLCSAMTCSCAKSTIEVEKEPSIIEEFDPYTRSWHGSQYGSR